MRRILLSLLFMLSITGFVATFDSTAQAFPDANLGANSPRGENSYNPPNAHVHFLRKSGAGGVQPDVQLKAYYPADVTNWNSLYVQFSPGHALNDSHVCNAEADGNTNRNRFISVTLKTGNGSGQTRQYYIPFSRVCVEKNALNATGTNSNNAFYARYDLPNKPGLNDFTKRFEVDITISYDSSVPHGDNGVRFRAGAPNGNPKIGPTGGGDVSFPVLGDWSIHTQEDRDTRIVVPFGASCEGSDVLNPKIRIYDADNGPAGFSHDVMFKVKNIDTGNYETLKNPGSARAGTGQRFDNNTTYRPPNGMASEVGASWVEIDKMAVGDRYQMEVYGLNPRNTIDIGVPGDTIYGDLGCPNSARIVPKAGPDGAVLINNPFTFTNWAETSKTNNTQTDTFRLNIRDNTNNLPPGADWGPSDRQINPDRDVPTGRSSYTFTPTIEGRYCRQTVISRYPDYVKVPNNVTTAEQCVDVTAPKDRVINLNPVVTPQGSEVEAEDPAVFNGYVNVVGYPQIVEWGYDNQAVAQASTRYTPTFRGPVDSSTEYSTASSSQQYCSNGGQVSKNCYIAPYTYCAWSSGAKATKACPANYVLTTNPGSTGYVYTWYSCPSAYPNGGGYSSTCYRPVYRCTETGGAYSPNYPSGCREYIQCEDNAYPTGWHRTIPNGRQCDIWRCQYPDTPKYKQSNQPLCAYRCSNGYASQAAKTWSNPGQAPLATAGSSDSGYPRYNAGDLNCYIETRFNFTCEWRTASGTLVEPAQTVSVNYTNSSQRLCQDQASIPTTLIGQQLCVTYRAIAPAAPYFSEPRPGKKQNQTWGVVGGTDTDCMDVVGKPYVRVVGGDAASGIGAGGTSASCTSNNSATIVAHNKGSSQGYKGSGASVAAIARGSITGFGSAQFATASLGVVPKSISFANDTGTWGGNWGSSVACLATDGLVTTGNALPPSPISTEQRVRMSGNVFIGSNITYQTGKWNGVDKLPLFQLVVNGNIYIGNNVTQLDGLYVAQGGSIYTCANISGPILNAWSNNPAEQCNRQLIVNGSLVGDRVYLTRDCATSNRASVGETTIFTASGSDVQNCNTTSTTKASEVINFLPEQWIRGSIGRPDTRYDAVTNMPPVL